MFQLFGLYIRHTFSTWVNEGPNYKASTTSYRLPFVIDKAYSKFPIDMHRCFISSNQFEQRNHFSLT